MQLDRQQTLGMAVIGGIALLIVGGGFIANSKGKGEPPPLVPVPVATPAQPIVLAAGGSPQNAPTSSPTPTPAPDASTPTPSAPTALTVFVTGAVKKEGVYKLKPGDRINDAIQAAGGFKENAQTDALNLADFARDADHYSVPTKTATGIPVKRPAIVHGNAPASAGKVAAPTAPSTPGRVLGKSPGAVAPAGNTGETARHSSGHTSTKFKNPGDGTVNINTASAEELQKLPGVGPSTAQHILEYRQQIGQFSNISQIKDVKGIGPKKLEKMEPFLRL